MCTQVLGANIQDCIGIEDSGFIIRHAVQQGLGDRHCFAATIALSQSKAVVPVILLDTAIVERQTLHCFAILGDAALHGQYQLRDGFDVVVIFIIGDTQVTV